MHGTDAGGNQQVAMLRAGFLVFQQAAGASETRRMTNVAGIGMGLMNAGEQLERAKAARHRRSRNEARPCLSGLSCAENN